MKGLVGERPRRSFRLLSLIFQSRRFALWCQPIWMTLAAIFTTLHTSTRLLRRHEHADP
jgi:hypothetical protein